MKIQSQEIKEKLAGASPEQLRSVITALEVPDAVLIALFEHDEKQTQKPRAVVHGSNVRTGGTYER
jgi:hypothetical protein